MGYLLGFQDGLLRDYLVCHCVDIHISPWTSPNYPACDETAIVLEYENMTLLMVTKRGVISASVR
jgi:hypothetical protein